MRTALETELLYAVEFPFLDYGSDLNIMAEMEKGVQVQKLATTENDANPPQKEQEEVDKYLSRMPKRKYDKVPIDFVGKGPGGYLLYDHVFHKTGRAPQVSQKFKDVVRRAYTGEEHRTRAHRVERMKVGGPRFASMKRRV